jgi:hypothetical protein
MNKLKVLLGVLVFAISIFVSHANAASEFQVDRIELGLSAGVGFYMGQNHIGDFTRIQCYDILGSTLQDRRLKTNWPGIETFGFSLGYRFNTMFNLKLQTTRQRIAFMEYEGANSNGFLYYNAMWHTDAMLEYNILPYGLTSSAGGSVYNIVPYVGLGLGVTVYNQEASLRNANLPKPNATATTDIFAMYPRVGFKQVWELPYDKFGQPTDSVPVLKWKKADTGVALYIPIAMGAKWRIDEHWQLKATFQYQLYFQNASKEGLNSNLDGGTFVDRFAIVNGKEYTDLTPDRPKFDYLDQNNKKVVGQNHDFLFSLTAIFNFSTWYEERIVEY